VTRNSVEILLCENEEYMFEPDGKQKEQEGRKAHCHLRTRSKRLNVGQEQRAQTKLQSWQSLNTLD
jgi:hypothetical protein